MQIYNQTGYPALFTMGMDKAAHEYVVLVAKATFDFPTVPGGPALKSAEQVALVMADIAAGEPGYSDTLWETDFAFRKPRCDVVLQGCAYAPNGRAADRVRVGLKVGNWSKMFDVFGHREWRSIGPTFHPTSPAPFIRQPFGYGTAFGGVDRLDPDDKLPDSYRLNPVGRGWSRTRNQRFIPGLPLPNTQAVDENVTSPFGTYKPMAFGPVGRGWPGRIEFGGTYDQKWTDEVFPFLPADFDERYFQMTLPDQQIDPPRSGTEVILGNLTPDNKINFRLPTCELPVTLFKGQDIAFEGDLQPDTLLFDPESRRFSMVWRVSSRYQRSILEFTEAWVGPPTEAMLRARREGRGYLRAAGEELQEEDA